MTTILAFVLGAKISGMIATVFVFGVVIFGMLVYEGFDLIRTICKWLFKKIRSSINS